MRATMNVVFEKFGHGKKGKITDLETLYKVQTKRKSQRLPTVSVPHFTE